MNLDNNCDKMIEIMKQCHQEVEVTDMTNITGSSYSYPIDRHLMIEPEFEFESDEYDDEIEP